MRGRGALRLVGVVKTMDVRLDLSDEVCLYVLTSFYQTWPHRTNDGG
jgi:hypothetical protein